MGRVSMRRSKRISRLVIFCLSHRSAEKRGASVCFSLAHVSAKRVEQALQDDEFKLGHKFEIDTRPGGDGPDTYRLTAHYAHMSFVDTATLALCLKQVYDKLRSENLLEAKRPRLAE